MDFCFNPDHEHGFPHVGHCPHLGGTAVETLVYAANEHGQIDRNYWQIKQGTD